MGSTIPFATYKLLLGFRFAWPNNNCRTVFTSTYLTDDLTSSDGPEITGSFDIVLYKNCIGEISRVLVNFLSQKPMMFVQNRCDVNSRAAPVCQRHCHCHCQSQTNSHSVKFHIST